jgi:hypothetical protein
VTIIKSANGDLFGGYTAVSWTSRGGFAYDNTAFLFTLINPNGIPPTKYSIVNVSYFQYAIFDAPNHGPTFGSAHDICVRSTTLTVNFPVTYQDTTGYRDNTFTGKNQPVQVTDIEVYKCIS